MIDAQASVNTGGNDAEKFYYQVDAVELSGEDESGQEGATNAPESQRCEFCHCSRTPLWRRGPQGKRTLCNACGIRWSSRAKEAKAEPQNYLVNDHGDEEAESYQLDCRSSENATFNPRWKEEEEGSTFVVRDDGSDSSSVEEGPEAHESNAALAPLEGDEEGESHSDIGQDANDAGWEEGYDDKLARDLMEEGEDDSDDAAPMNPEEAEDEALSGVVKIEGGKEQYYCKYCDTSWPYNHFRNAQQFGAHCSNCSRKRKVKDPQELTIRERNKRLRKAKKPSGHPEKKKQRPSRHSLEPSADGMEFDDDGADEGVSEGESFGGSAISVLQKVAITSDKEWGQEKARPKSRTNTKADVDDFLDLDSAAGTRGRRSRSNSRTKRKYDDFAESVGGQNAFAAELDMQNIRFAHRPRRNSVTSRGGSASEAGPKKNTHKGEHRKRTSSAKRRKPMLIVTPDDELEQEAIISDPNSVGGLLAAIERKLTAEKKKRELSELKQRVWAMRKEVGEEYNSRLDDLRFRSVALVQELRVDMVAKLEGLKLDLASELSFRETRRKKRLNEMRIQMNALNRILESGKKDRENGLLVSTFGGKFDTALKQLEELKMNLQKEFSSREQAMQQQFSEMRATCSLHLANIKQQIHEELNIREGRMQKELEDMKHKLHSVCSQIGAENYCPEPSLPPHSPMGSMPLSAMPAAPEKFTTTTTTTTTTTITTNINTTSPLPILPATMGLGVPLAPLAPVGLGRPMGMSGPIKVPSTPLGKQAQLQQQQQPPSGKLSSPSAGILPSFGALDIPGEVKSSTS